MIRNKEKMTKKWDLLLEWEIIILILMLFVTAFTYNEITVYAADSGVADVSVGDHHVAIVKTDGTLWTCGENERGQLGTGNTEASYKHVKIMDSVKAVSAGQLHTAILKTDGTLWTCGYNHAGQLGDKTTTNRLSPVKVMTDVRSVAVGKWHTAILKTDGTLWMCGENRSGQLGIGKDQEKSIIPTQIMSGVKAVSAGQLHTAILKTDGTLWMCGHNGHGELGIGENSLFNIFKPVKVMDSVRDVSTKWNHTAILKIDGTLWMCGDNSYGQLGDGTTTRRRTPVKIMSGVQAVSAGWWHTVFLKTDGTLWTCGEDSWGYSRANRKLPEKILENVKFASAGIDNTAVIKTDGSLWMWGNNWQGQFGDGTTKSTFKPIQVIGTTSAEDNSVTNNTQTTPQTQPTAKSYKVTYKLNGKGAKFTKKGEKGIRTVTNGEKYGAPPEVKRTGYALLGWFTKEKGGVRITKDTIALLSGNINLHAHWGYTVKFDANKGKVSPKKENYEINAKYGKLPIPTRNNYTFDGWYTKKTGGTLVTKNSKCKKNTTLHAHWGYKVFLIPNGARITNFSVVEVPGEKYKDLPTLRKSGYTFAGWYTKNKGGEKITNGKTKVNLKTDTYLYAHWDKGSVQPAPDKTLGKIKKEDKYDTLSKKFRTDHYDILKNGSIEYRDGYFVFSKGKKSFAISRKALNAKKGNLEITPAQNLSPSNDDIVHDDIITYKIGNIWTFAKIHTWTKIMNNNQIEIRIFMVEQLNFKYVSSNTIKKRSTVFHVSNAPNLFFYRNNELFETPQTLVNPILLASEDKGEAIFDTEHTTTHGIPIKKGDYKEVITIAEDAIDLVKDLAELKKWNTAKNVIDMIYELKESGKSKSEYTSNRTIDLSDVNTGDVKVYDPYTVEVKTSIGLCENDDYCEVILRFPNNTTLTTEEFFILYFIASVSSR